MVRLLSEKSNIAWFKLAEFVDRKEKERALGIYRLLIHSLEDPAYMFQLEGDLLAAFHDVRAIESYRRAAQLYEESGRVLSAALIYERLTFLYNSIEQICESWQRAHDLYVALGSEAKVTHCMCALARLGVTPQTMQLQSTYVAACATSDFDAKNACVTYVDVKGGNSPRV